MRMLQHGSQPTQLGDALPHFGRIFKTLHVLAYVDTASYRRDIKSIRNLQESQHSLARHIFHGRKGELHRAYTEGVEDQLGALGLVLNCITLRNTVYLDAALTRLRAEGYPVLDADVERFSPYVNAHLNVRPLLVPPTRPWRTAPPPTAEPRRRRRLGAVGEHDTVRAVVGESPQRTR